MFQTITSLGNILLNGSRVYRYGIVDSCFVETVVSKSAYHDSYEVALQIIQFYKRRNLNVASNLAAYYLYLANSGFSIRDLIMNNHPFYIDAADKSIHYAVRYRPILKIRLPKFFSPAKAAPKYSIALPPGTLVFGDHVH